MLLAKKISNGVQFSAKLHKKTAMGGDWLRCSIPPKGGDSGGDGCCENATKNRPFGSFDSKKRPVICSARRKAKADGKPLQEVENMQEDKGMNANELQEFKAALLNAERLEILAILRDAETLEEAQALIEQRRKG